MQWPVLGLVAVFGTASLLTRDPVFVQAQPSLVYAAVGPVMLRRGWMTAICRRSPAPTPPTSPVPSAPRGRCRCSPPAGNLVLARYASPATWSWFVAIVPLGSKTAAIVGQAAITRAVVGRRLAARRAARPA